MADPETPDAPRIEPAHGPAGGWPAVGAGLRHILHQQQPGAAAGALLRVNQPTGFDCPGCAWPEPARTGTFEFCENGIKAVAWETTGRRVTPAFFEAHPVAELAGQSDHWLEDQGRLTHPMRYDAATDRYRPVTWDQAFRLIADHLAALDSPDEACFYTSGRTSNEAAFLYQLFARLYGTNNLPDCSNMCHESSGFALGEQIGIGKGTVQLWDFDKAEAILIVGQNPGTNHPRMLSALEKAARRGCRIITLNPLKEKGLESFLHPQHPVQMLTGRATRLSELYLQPRVGGDLAAAQGIMKHLLALEEADPGTVLDHAFIREHTTGFETWQQAVTGTPWETIETQSGLSREALGRVADLFAASRATILCWAMGLTQQPHAVATIQTLVNLLLATGNIGRPGAGACPVRGHSNVQGDRTVGITERPGPAFLEGLRRAFDFDPPEHHGHDVVGAIEAMASGSVKVFVSMGGNFASATPDTPYTARALRQCALTVQISTKLNRSHLEHGRDALILPCLARSERDVQAGGEQRVTVEDSMSQVHASGGRKAPASEHLRSEPAIVAGMARACFAGTGREHCVNWEALVADYGRIRQKMAEVMPETFADYNRRIEQPGGFYLGNSARERTWRTPSGRAHFMTHPIPELTLPDGQLCLMSVRSHDQYNTTIYGHDDRYRGVYGTRRVVFVHPEDLAARNLRDGERVDLAAGAHPDGRERRVSGFTAVAYEVPRGCAAAYFPEVNPLVPAGAFADKSRTPLSKWIPITLERAPASESDPVSRL